MGLQTWFDLSGRAALVTGAGTGRGRGFARTLALAGATVTLAGRRREPLESCADQIRSAGGVAHWVQMDVSSAESVATAFGRIGPVDVLVNNAGIAGVGGLIDLAEESWDK